MISAKDVPAASGWQNFVTKLNTGWHEKALWLYTFVVLLHWVEHLAQAFQIFVLGMPRPQSLGWLGMAWPWLVQSETLHFGYAVFMLGGLVLLRPGFFGSSRTWWTVSLIIQGWHLIEHTLLQGQALFRLNLFNAAVPTSVLQVWFPRPELHLFYNAAVFLPMVIAMVLHRYPPAGELQHFSPQCTCAVKKDTLQAAA